MEKRKNKMEKLENQKYGKVDSKGKPYVEDIRGKQKREEVYAEQFNKGYTFRTNSPIKRFAEDVTNLERAGLEVFVGSRAFYMDGTEDSGLRTILARERKK